MASYQWLGEGRLGNYLETTMHSFNSCLRSGGFSTKERRAVAWDGFWANLKRRWVNEQRQCQSGEFAWLVLGVSKT